MKVKNDFPNVDRVLSKLREYVDYFERKQKGEITSEEREDCEFALEQVDKFIDAIEDYLDSVCNDQDRIARHKDEGKTGEELQYYIKEYDERRTRNHSTIIETMVLIDRMAKREDISKVFDYAGKYENNYAELTPSTIEDKQEMSLEARVKRREMGNFGLYIAASVSVGLEMPDKDVRAFASCDSEKDFDESNIAYSEVKNRLNQKNVRSVGRNMNDMIR